MSRRPGPHSPSPATSPIANGGTGSSTSDAGTSSMTVGDDTPSASNSTCTTVTDNSGRDPYLNQIHSYFSGRLAALYESRSFDTQNVLHAFETDFVSVKTNEPFGCFIAESSHKCSMCVGVYRVTR